MNRLFLPLENFLRAPATGYNIFFREEHARIKTERQGMRFGVFAEAYSNDDEHTNPISLVGSRWKKLSPCEKMVYQTKAKQDRVRYAHELIVWQEQKQQAIGTEEGSGSECNSNAHFDGKVEARDSVDHEQGTEGSNTGLLARINQGKWSLLHQTKKNVCTPFTF